MAQTEKILLWLEDVPKTVENQLDFAEKKITVKRVAQLHDFAELLEDSEFSEYPKYKVQAIVLDIMLYGVHNLEGLKIEGVNTDRGYEAGLKILDKYLRPPDSKFKHIPILILSVLDLKRQEAESKEKRAKLQERIKLIEDVRSQGGAPLDLIEKRGSDDWEQEFKDWLLKTLQRS